MKYIPGVGFGALVLHVKRLILSSTYSEWSTFTTYQSPPDWERDCSRAYFTYTYMYAYAYLLSILYLLGIPHLLGGLELLG